MCRQKIIIICIFVCALLLTGYGLQQVKSNYRAELLGDPIVQRMIPMYRSLRKLPDIVFMPWSAFAKSNLETYEISISPKNIELMNEALPQSPFHTNLFSESRLWMPAYFRTSDYEGKIQIRYRGNLPSHWNAYQKSYAIKFPKSNLFRGQEKINLVIPSDRRYIDMALNDYRAEKLELIHPKESYVRVEINGADSGVLLAFEAWSQPWIEKMPISALSTIYGVDDDNPNATYRENWNSWNMEPPIDFDPLEALLELIEHAPDDVFAKLIPQLIDIEDWYAWDTIRILATGYHGGGGTPFGDNNLVLVFDRAEGRFKPVPYNTIIYTPSIREMAGHPNAVHDVPPLLFQRILTIPEFRARRDEVFAQYVKNEKDDDLAFLENWKKTYNREFLLDNAKNDNHFMYLAKVEESFEAIVKHFDDPFNMIEIVYDPPVEALDTLTFPNSFKYLEASGADVLTASKQHPSLRVEDDTLTFPAGTHTITNTIIIPAGTQLTIKPGAHLKMARGASLISYSPVSAKGTAQQPITVEPLTSDAWGVFAVVNTNKSTSTFTHVNLTKGSEDTVNGAYISGTLALHNAESIIDHVTVTDAQGDDGLNVKGSYVELTNSTFDANSSDGIDLDYIDPASVIAYNTFTDNRGDALDISWSEITINNNVIDTCADKGISVGEQSKPTIVNNTIQNCPIGIAVKDSSEAEIRGNTLTENVTAFSLYKKKEFFGGGTAHIYTNTLSENERLVYTDEFSTAEFLDGKPGT